MDNEIFHNLGFTPAETKVYLSLLQIGSSKVGGIIEKSGLQSSTIHNTLHTLLDKGVVTYILKGKIKIYQAADPKLILRLFKEKELKFEKVLPELQAMQPFGVEKQQAEVYEGVKGMTTMYNELIDGSKKRDVFYFFSVDVKWLNKEAQAFFEKYDAKRKTRGLVVRGLARKELRPLFIHRKSLKMRYTNFPIPSNIGICNNKMALINWGEKPVGILVRSQQLIDNQIEFFNELWKNAKV